MTLPVAVARGVASPPGLLHVMPPVPPAESRAASEELRAVLAARGWRARRASGAGGVDGAEHRLTLLAARGRRKAFLCDPPPNSSLPDYAARRRLRAALGRSGPAPLIVFTDASDSIRVWSWMERGPQGVAGYREERCAPGSPPPDLRLCGRAAPAPPARLRARSVEGGTRVLLALLEGVRRSIPHAPPPPGAAAARRRALELVENVHQPWQLRAVWSALCRLRVLERGRGSGIWLLGALLALEGVYSACLRRMGVWVADEGAYGPRLKDFRAILCRARDTSLYPTPRHYVRESILLRNLHAALGDEAAASACRARLLHALAGEGEAGADPLSAFCNVRAIPAPGDPLAPGRLVRSLRPCGCGGAAAAILARAEALGRTERLIRHLRLEKGAPALETATALASLEGRRRRLLREVDAISRAQGRSILSLRTWVAFPEALCAGGFGVVGGG